MKFTVTDPDGAPVDLTGTVTAQVRDARADAAAVQTFAIDLTSHATGVVYISLTGAQTAGLLVSPATSFDGFYDVQWSPAGGQPITLVQGEVTCTLDVTRP